MVLSNGAMGGGDPSLDVREDASHEFGHEEPRMTTSFDRLAWRRSRPQPRKWDHPKVKGLLGGDLDVGMPLGGIGTGGLVHAASGGFTRWTWKAGAVKIFREPACGFALWNGEQAVALQPQPGTSQLSSFRWADETLDGDYAALFPLARHTYRLPALQASCEAFSPILPNDLEAAATPVALFRWELRNEADEDRNVAVLAHFANMLGWFDDWSRTRPTHRNAGNHNRLVEAVGARGVAFERTPRIGPVPEGHGSMALLAERAPGWGVSVRATFDGLGDGGEVWTDFARDGRVEPSEVDWIAVAGFAEEEVGLPCGALAARACLAPGEARAIHIALAWDLPTIRFGSGRTYRRFHTARWGDAGSSAATIAEESLHRAPDWHGRIEAWHAQTEALLGSDPCKAGVAQNELYMLVDGCTALTAPDDRGRSRFGLIECPDYPYYDTFDLWIYASDAVLRHWPELERLVVEAYAGEIPREDGRHRLDQHGHAVLPIQRAGALPHDLGAPGEDPFRQANGYAWQDSTGWKDLNAQFVLCLWRDGRVFGEEWLRVMADAAFLAIDHLCAHDRDGDGLIENDGADSTFDNIPMRGPSAYCGGLWLGALAAGEEIAAIVGSGERQERYGDMLRRGRAAFVERLWTGTHFRLDTHGPLTDALLLEQLFGVFLARRLGLGDIVDADKARRTLRTLFEVNYERAGRGRGAVMIAMPDGTAPPPIANDVPPSFQTSEVLVGINHSFAAQLEAWDLEEEARQLRASLYGEVYGRSLAFRTPAALDLDARTFRAAMNLRPLAAWLTAPPATRS